MRGEELASWTPGLRTMRPLTGARHLDQLGGRPSAAMAGGGRQADVGLHEPAHPCLDPCRRPGGGSSRQGAQDTDVDPGRDRQADEDTSVSLASLASVRGPSVWIHPPC